MAVADAGRPETATQFERASFTGSASEYFGIWIVNVLLTIITFGIYSAWAKVRRNRYFYGNTVILGRAFEYHATGKQIFIGRVIVFLFFIGIQIIAAIHPLFVILTTVLIFIALPWLVARGLRFNARVTSYRNVRFDFVGSVKGAFVAVVLGSFVSFLSLGILAPFASRWLYRYVFGNMRYGDRPFVTEPRVGALYGVWFVPALMVVIGAVLCAIVGLAMSGAIMAIVNNADMTEEEMILTIVLGVYLAFFVVFIVYGLAALVYRAGVRNVVFSSTKLDDKHELMSDMSRARYAWIAISNVIVTILTLGLMRPWAAVRLARYMTAHTGITIHGDVGEILSSIESTGAAMSAEYMDMEGIDFGF